jgi:hypothetical protein
MADLISGIKIPDSKIAAKQRDWFVNMRRKMFNHSVRVLLPMTGASRTLCDGCF